MFASVWRLFEHGQPIDRDKLRRTSPAQGELAFRHRLTGRGERWDVFLAVLMRSDYCYVIPALDGAKLIELRGRWLHLRGLEVIPRGTSWKRIPVDRHIQEWWCRIDGSTSISFRAQAQPRQSHGLVAKGSRM